jgi:Ankyrin repeats (3 copies)
VANSFSFCPFMLSKSIRSPFCLDKSGEDFYPIHMAILGGNLDVIRWIVEVRMVPLQMQRKKGRKSMEVPILTSHGRSPMMIALLHQRLDIVQYLVAELNQSLFAEENLNPGVALANFTSLLKMLPTDFFEGRQIRNTTIPQMSPGSTQSQSLSYASSDGSGESLA